MSYTQISQNLFLRPSPQRCYQPITRTRPSYCETYIPSCYTSCFDYCCCHCCCHCCCCYNICYEPYKPRLHFDYSSSPEIKNISKKEGEDQKNITASKNEEPNEEKKEENEPPKEEPNENNNINENENYEQNQFNDFMKKLMGVESQIEDAKINLAKNEDFNCEDAFRLFESNGKGTLDKNDLKNGLNLLGINPSEQDLNLLLKRFDLQKNGFINYADFFDLVVPFEKNQRQIVENREPKSNVPLKSPDIFNEKTVNDLKNLFELIIKSENEINNDRKTLGTLRLKLKEIFGMLDKNGKGFFDIDEMMVYFANNGILENNKDADLLFIRLDKNRNGKIDYHEVEDELQTLF